MTMRIQFLFGVSLWFTASAVSQGVDVRNTEVSDFKTHVTTPEYRSVKDWESHKAHVRRQILSAAGLLPLPQKTPLRPRVVRRLDYGEYSIEVVLIESLPGYYVGADLYLPASHLRKGAAPAVMVPHGHWKHGRLEDQPSYSVPALAINLARQGYVVFAYDMVGYNDTRQTPHSFEGVEYALWSFTPMGLQLWNAIRAVDFLQSLPEVDGARIGVTGASGGGSQAICLMAVDDRIKVSVPVNMVSAYMQGGDPCEEAPGLRLETSNVEIAALAAPKPMLLVSCTRDWTRHTPVEEFPAIRKIYELYGHAESVESVQFDAEHNFNRQSREAVYRFLAAHLQPGLASSRLAEREIQLPREDDLLAFPKGDLPLGTENFDQVFQTWKVITRLETETLAAADLRDALRTALSVEVGPAVESRLDGEKIVLSRIAEHDRVTGYWLSGKGTPVLIVDPAGADAARHSDLATAVIHAGRPVLIIDPFRSSAKRAEQTRYSSYFLSYNRSDDAERVQDILTALSFLHMQAKGTPEVIGVGKAGIASLYAAAVSGEQIDLIADLNGFSGSDENFAETFFVPGIQHAGGLTAALRLVNSLRAAIPARHTALSR